MRLLIRTLVLACLVILCAAPLRAEEAAAPAGITNPAETAPRIDPRKLLVPPKNADGTIITAPFWQDPVRWMAAKQQNYYGSMARALRNLRGEGRTRASLLLFVISFAYGVFHAAGPGHGKTVISAWLLATETELKRGITVAFLSSIIQALTAITLVSLLLLVVASAGAMARNTAGYLESASYLMIAGLGFYLLYTGLPRRKLQAEAQGPSPGPIYKLVTPHAGHRSGPHVVRNATCSAGHGPDACNCGHNHAPTPAAVAGSDWSWPKALTMAFAIGIRPCTGAILVLVMANALGIYWAGVASTLAMGFGTFLTVSAIAAVAVLGKGFAARLAGTNGRLAHWLPQGLRLAGGLLIAGLGILMFLGSLAANPVMM